MRLYGARHGMVSVKLQFETLGIDLRGFAERENAPHKIRQLAYIARPRVRLQALNKVRMKTRTHRALLRRAQEMKMEFIYMKQPLKMPAYEEILKKAGVTDAAVAYVGDDLPDLPLLRRVGLAVAVGDAVPEVKNAAHYTTKAVAGHGAIREAVELILKSKGIWAAMIDKARA